MEPSPEDLANQMTPGFLHGGDTEVDGRPCVRVVEAPLPPNDRLPPDAENYAGNGMLVLDLATDRNDIPARVQNYQRMNGRWPVLTFLATCGDFREIAPGDVVSFHLPTEYTIDYWAMLSDGWAVIDAHRETTVESAGPASRVSDATFRDVTVPAGATIQVLAESGQGIGQVEQPDDGVPGSRESVISRREQPIAEEHREAQPRQQVAFPQPGLREPPPQPAPELPRGASWRNGGPSTWEALRGRVAVLVFWAEWDDEGREALAKLDRLHRDADRDGPAVIDIHPPGAASRAWSTPPSPPMKLDFPTMVVDPDGSEKATAWGRLAGQLDVHSVPVCGGRRSRGEESSPAGRSITPSKRSAS